MKSRLVLSTAIALICLPLFGSAQADSAPPATPPPAADASAPPSGVTPSSQAPAPAVVSTAPDTSAAAGAAARAQASAKVKQLEVEVRSDSLNVEKRFALGNAYYDEGRLNEALIQFNRSIALDSTFWKAWVNVGTVNDELGKSGLATTAFQRAIELHPGDTFAYVKLANSAYAHGDVSTGIENYRKALAIDRKCLEAHFMLGNAFAEQEMYRQAVREWKKVQAYGGPAAPESKLAQDNLQTVYAFFAEEPAFSKKLQAITAEDSPAAPHKAVVAAAKSAAPKAAAKPAKKKALKK